MIDYFKALLDKSNPASTMRWAFIFTYVFVLLIVFITWTALVIKKGEMVDIPGNVFSLVSAIIGIVTLGKVFQTKFEGGNGDVGKPQP